MHLLCLVKVLPAAETTNFPKSAIKPYECEGGWVCMIRGIDSPQEYF